MLESLKYPSGPIAQGPVVEHLTADQEVTGWNTVGPSIKKNTLLFCKMIYKNMVARPESISRWNNFYHFSRHTCQFVNSYKKNMQLTEIKRGEKICSYN